LNGTAQAGAVSIDFSISALLCYSDLYGIDEDNNNDNNGD
jgi:hypothetical protein